MLGKKIQLLRKGRGLSQEQLAIQLTVSRQAISKWELGEAMPDTENIIQLSKVFGVSTDYLLNDDYNCDMDIPVVRETYKKLQKSKKRMIIFAIIHYITAITFILTAIIGKAYYYVIPAVVFIIAGTIGVTQGLSGYYEHR